MHVCVSVIQVHMNLGHWQKSGHGRKPNIQLVSGQVSFQVTVISLNTDSTLIEADEAFLVFVVVGLWM